MAQVTSKDAVEELAKALDAEKTLVKAQKDLAEALKALSGSKPEESKPESGGVTQGPYTGSVDLKDKGGELPVALLEAKAVRDAARRVAKNLNDILTGGKDILIFASSEVPTFQNLAAYRAQFGLVERALAEALKEPKGKAKFAKVAEIIPVLGGVGVALDAIDKLMGFFRTDYTVGGVEVPLDDSVLVLETANWLSRGHNVKLPALYYPKAILAARTAFFDDLKNLAKRKAEAVVRAAKQGNAANPNDAQKNVSDNLKKAVAICDQFLTKMTTPNEKTGQIPIAVVVWENETFELLNNEGAYLLVLHIQKAGGGYLIKRNPWTFLGRTPLFFHGGAVVTYALLQGSDGQVCRSGVIPIYGGWVKVNEINKSLEENRKPSGSQPN
jgi:hypothetical protein